MAIFYPFTEHFPLWQVIGALLLIIVMTTFVIVMVKRLPYLFVGWMWFSITIALVIGIIQVSIKTPYAMADRYHYLPSIGLAVMMAWGIPAFIKSEAIRKKILFPAGIIFLAIMAFLSWNQCGYWKNSINLFSHALQVTKDNYLAHVSYGLALFEERKFEDAIDHYTEAIRLKPDYMLSYNNRGNAYDELGQYQRAIEDYTEAIRLEPDYVEAYSNRGKVYNNLGQYHRAIQDCTKAIRMKPDCAEAYNNRGIAYLLQGNHELGCPDAQKVCVLGNCKLLEMAKGKGLCH